VNRCSKQSAIVLPFCKRHFTSHPSDGFRDPVNCRFTCWIPGFVLQFSQPQDMTVYWDVSPFSLIEIDQRSRGAYCLHHQDDEKHAREGLHISLGWTRQKFGLTRKWDGGLNEDWQSKGANGRRCGRRPDSWNHGSIILGMRTEKNKNKAMKWEDRTNNMEIKWKFQKTVIFMLVAVRTWVSPIQPLILL
jgi:hypothetical protein